MVMKVHIFVFTPYQVNTYVVSDSSGACVVIDPACGEPREQEQLAQYLRQHNLVPEMIVNTHGHFDHILGNAFVARTFGVPTAVHPDALPFLEYAWKQGEMFGYEVEAPPTPQMMLSDGGSVTFGTSALQVFHTPGHAPGSVVLYAPEDKFLIAGDVLFRGSIGRTDLTGGDYDLLMDSLYQKVLVLPRDTKVFCGHGPSTTLEHEILNNPFLSRLGC